MSWLLAPPATMRAFRHGSVAAEIAPPSAQGAKTSASASKIASGETTVAPVRAATAAAASAPTSQITSRAPAAASLSARIAPTWPTPWIATVTSDSERPGAAHAKLDAALDAFGRHRAGIAGCGRMALEAGDEPGLGAGVGEVGRADADVL